MGDSQLVFNYLLNVWKCHQPTLAEVVTKIKKLIRKIGKVELQWVKREFNAVADNAAGMARKERGLIILENVENVEIP